MTDLHACRECGEPVAAAPGRAAVFCSAPCRSDFNNRRKARGAELYDVYMACRYERPLARALKLWGLLARLAKEYRRLDRVARQGRKSWTPARELGGRYPHVFAQVLIRRRHAGETAPACEPATVTPPDLVAHWRGRHDAALAAIAAGRPGRRWQS